MPDQSAAFLRRLSTLIELGPLERDVLAEIRVVSSIFKRGTDIAVFKDTPQDLVVILDGWAARYDVRSAGGRRITGFLLPGDFCGVQAICSAALDHSVIALTDCRIGRITRADWLAAVDRAPQLELALWRAKLTEETTLRQWLLKSGDSCRAVAHLICELFHRGKERGLVLFNQLSFPLTQEEMGDALGITNVHTNRVLRRLRADGLISLHARELKIDATRLAAEGDFDPSYLAPWR